MFSTNKGTGINIFFLFKTKLKLMQALLFYFTYYCGIIFTVIDNRES